MPESFQEVLSTAFSLFIVMNSIGSMSLFIHLLKGINPKRQKQIVFRELIIALFVIISFNFIGQGLFKFLHISQESVQIAGGIILFLLSLKMLFPPDRKQMKIELKKITEPFIVPLAIPIIAGPAALAAVMLYSHQHGSDLITISAIVIAWFASFVILMLSSRLAKLLGDKGILAMERLMGFIMVLIAVNMLLNGVKEFIYS